MVGFVLTEEHVREAPPAVRAWLRAHVAATLGGEAPAGDQQSTSLAPLSPEEAVAVFQLIRHDMAATQVFLDLGRDSPPGLAHPQGLHRVLLADLAHAARLERPEQLGPCMDAIAAAWRIVHPTSVATAFAIGQQGSLYVHEATHQSIRALWEGLLAGPAMAPPA